MALEVVKSQQKTSTLRNVDMRANGEVVVVVVVVVGVVVNSRISTGLYSLRCLSRSLRPSVSWLHKVLFLQITASVQ